MASSRTVIALLRGINVAGKNKLPMAELRELATELGFANPRTYIQSGNLVFESRAKPASLERKLEKAIDETFGISTSVVVRTATRWLELAETSPFPDAEAKFLHYAASKLRPAEDVAARLQPYAKGGERVHVVADGLWIDYASGAGRSKITPTVLDRCTGSPVTARNSKTMQAVARMLG